MNEKELLKEVTYTATLSGGPGGQHANKANTKVILEWNLAETKAFKKEEIQRLRKNLKSYLSQQGVVQLSSGETRSQFQNKTMVTERFLKLLKSALKPRKKRKRPKPGKKFHEKRLEQKRRRAEKKGNRKNPLL